MATQIKISELPLANESALSVAADDRFIFNNDNVNTQTIKFGNLVDAICAQNLIFNGTVQFNQQLVGPNGGDLIVELDRLSDVTINNVQSGQLLQYNGAAWTNVDADDTQIDVGGLDDVTLTDLADGQYLVYNANSETWVNASAPATIGRDDFSVVTGEATSGGALTYNELTGVFTFQPDSNTGYATQVELTTLSVAVNERITAITGVPTGEVNLGTFNGSTISDNTNVKVALQELETAVEAGGGEVSAELIGVDAGDTDLGTFTNNPSYPASVSQISDNASVKEALQDLNNAVITNNQLTVLNISDTYAVFGVPSGDRDLGTFSGSTISDNTSVKAALQELEVAVEGAGGGFSGSYNDLTDTPTLGTAAATDATDYATAAQGLLAGSALQNDDIGTNVQAYDANTVVDADYATVKSDAAATATTAGENDNAIDNLIAGLVAIGNDAGISDVAGLKAALAALVRNNT